MQYRVYDRRKLAYIDGGYVVDYNIDDDYIVNNNSSISIVKETNAVEGDIIVLIKNSGPFHKGVITSVDNADLTISYKSDKQLFNDNMPNIKSADFAADSELTVAGKLGLKEVAEILKIVFSQKDPAEQDDNYDEYKALPLDIITNGDVYDDAGEHKILWTWSDNSINVVDWLVELFEKYAVVLSWTIDFDINTERLAERTPKYIVTIEQKNEIYVQTATDTYTTRETAGGENIADGVQTPVKKITGKTVKTTNLMPYPYYNPSPTVKNGITFTVNEDYSVTANGTATADANYILVINSNPILLDNSKAYTLSGCPSGGGDSTYRIYIQDTSFSETYIDRGDGMTFTPKNTEFYVYITISNGVTINNLVFKPMLNEGSTALSYMPYFPGLKNAFFKEIVSTGRNLFSAETAIPYNNCTYENGVVKQISADSADYYTWKIQFFKDSTFLTQSDVLFSQTGTIPALTIEKPSEANRLFLGLNGRERDTLMMIDVSNFPNGKYTATWNVLNITQGSVSWNNIMLNYGSSALPYEPYTQSVLSLPEAVELTEYDTAYPETGEIQRQSNTLTFNGTETWYTSIINNCYAYYVITKPVGFSTNGLISNKITTRAYTATSGQNEGCYMSNANFNAIVFWFLQTAYPNLSISAAWKAQLAAWNEAGNPLTVTYKTAEITTEQADFSADSYIAWKNGSETIEQGDTDNSEYGAENTVEQDYYLLTAPEEVTKE